MLYYINVVGVGFGTSSSRIRPTLGENPLISFIIVNIETKVFSHHSVGLVTCSQFIYLM